MHVLDFILSGFNDMKGTYAMAGRIEKGRLPCVTVLPSRIRRALGWRERTQKQMAQDLGLAENSLSNIMQGHTADPGIRVVYAIAEYLNVSSDFLLGLSEDHERR
jgi:DNA-binding XRE family transcriptional regulator